MTKDPFSFHQEAETEVKELRSSRPWSTILQLSGALGLGLLAPPAPAQEQVPDPPVLRFPAEGITLADAVRLTLRHDPNLKLREAEVGLQEGITQEQRGFFDLTLVGDVFYENRDQELRESRKKIEREKREQLDEAIAEGRSFRSEALAVLEALNRARTAPPGQENIPDPVIQAQLVAVNALINDVRDPLARQQLLDLRRKILLDNIDRISTSLNEVLADLAEAEDRRQKMGDVPNDEYFERARVNLGLDKLFRNGISVSPFFEGRFDSTNFKGKLKDDDLGGKGIEDLYSFRAGANLVVPLLRGRGSVSVAAGERAAELAHQATGRLARHQLAVSALETARAYWRARAAQDTVGVATRSVELQARLVEVTRALIAADELPRTELARVQGSEARARARLEAAGRELLEARVNLARVMGVGITEAADSLPRARDEFPALAETSLEPAEFSSLVRESVARRPDLMAIIQFEEAERLLQRGAQADLRPQLDLNLSGWYNALGEKQLSAAVDRWVGPSASFGLNFEKPLGNNFFRGRFVQRQAAHRQRRISAIELERQIKLAVVRAASSLAEAVARVRAAQASVGFYRSTIEAEIERFRTGESTLVDTILTEDQQTDALLGLVAAQRDYATLVAELRFESGLLVGTGSDERAVVPEYLVTVPRLGSRREP